MHVTCKMAVYDTSYKITDSMQVGDCGRSMSWFGELQLKNQFENGSFSDISQKQAKTMYSYNIGKCWMCINLFT